MMIRRESIANPELVHNGETYAIGKGPLFVAMLAKPVSCDVETCRINPFEVERLAAFDGIKKVCGSPMTVPRQQQSNGFVGYIFGGKEMPAFSD